MQKKIKIVFRQSRKTRLAKNASGREASEEAKLFYVPVSAAGMLCPPCTLIMCFEVSDDNGAVIFAKNTYYRCAYFLTLSVLLGDSSSA